MSFQNSWYIFTKKGGNGQRTEASAKVKEEIWSPLKQKKNGISSVTKFKIALRCLTAHVLVTIILVMINGTLAWKKKVKIGLG